MTWSVIFALTPVAALVALGQLLRRSEFLAPTFWPQAERLCYYVLLPALFAHGLAEAHLQSIPVLPLAGVLIFSTVVVAIILVLARPLVRVDGASFTSVFQGAVRFNNYVGVTLAAGLFGAKGVALAAVCNAAIVPTVNLLCVLVFARYGSSQCKGTALLRQIATNPLVVACLVGISMQMFGVTFPRTIEPAIGAIGAASMPLGLLCVGAALNFEGTKQWAEPVAVASVVKFLVMPVLTLAAARILHLSDPALTVALLFQALPTASSSYIMARQLGGDAPLMAGITAAQTVIAAGAMPVVLATLVAVHVI